MISLGSLFIHSVCMLADRDLPLQLMPSRPFAVGEARSE